MGERELTKINLLMKDVERVDQNFASSCSLFTAEDSAGYA